MAANFEDQASASPPSGGGEQFNFRKLLSDLAVYSAGSLLVKALSLISAPIFTRLFDPSQYGAWSFINMMVTFMTGLLLLGGDSAYTRYFFQCKDDREKQTLTATWLAFLALWSMVVLAAILPFSGTLSAWMLGEETYRAAWVIGLASSPLLMFNLSLAQALRNRFRAKAFALFNFFTALLTIALGVVFVIYFKLGVAGALLGAACASLVMIPFRIWAIRDLLSFSFSLRFLKKILIFGLPLVPMNIAFWLFSNADRLMLARIASLDEVGIYSIAGSLAAVIMLLQMSIGQSWQPHGIKTYEDDKSMAAEVFKRTMVLFLAAYGFVITGFVALSQEVLFILVPPAYYGAFAAIPFLAAGFLFFTSAHVTVVTIMVKNKTVYIMLVAWAVALVNLGLNALLIPLFGLAGAAAATGIAYTLFASGYAVIAYKLWPIAYPLRLVAVLLAAPLVSIFLIALIAQHGPGIVVNLTLKLIVLACCGFLIVLVVGKAEKKSLPELYQVGKSMLWKG